MYTSSGCQSAGNLIYLFKRNPGHDAEQNLPEALVTMMKPAIRYSCLALALSSLPLTPCSADFAKTRQAVIQLKNRIEHKQDIMAGGVKWTCENFSCSASTFSSNLQEACKTISSRFGKIASYRVNNLPVPEKILSACNGIAGTDRLSRDTSPRIKQISRYTIPEKNKLEHFYTGGSESGLLVDEADAISGKREQIPSADDRFSDRTGISSINPASINTSFDNKLSAQKKNNALMQNIQTDSNSDGTGFVLVETFAHSADTLPSYSDEVSNDTYLATAKNNSGISQIPESPCTERLAPVCGLNGKTYRNACLAKQAKAKVKIKYKGRCKEVIHK